MELKIKIGCKYINQYNKNNQRKGKDMKKVFISQPFSGRTEEEIFKQRGEIISYLKSVISDEELYVFDQYHQTEAPPESGSLYYLGNDIHMMSLADLIVFSSDWHSAHGCRVERFVAQEYGFAMIEVPGDTKDKTKPEEKYWR